MNGLNAYPRSIPRFQSGGSTGFSIGTAPAQSGVLDTVFSPIEGTPQVNTPFGVPMGVSFSTLAGLANPALAAPLGVISLGKMAVDAFNAKQDPAPITDATLDAYSPPTPGIAIGAPAAVSVEGISPGATAPGQAQSVLDAMITNFAQEQAQSEQEANQSLAAQQAVDAAMGPSDPDASAASAAAAAAAAATGGTGTGFGGDGSGFGGYSTEATVGVDANDAPGDGGGGGGPSDGGDGTGDGRRRGGFIMNYRYGGQIMNYAKGGEAYGRNGDSMLVHMNPREVAGLQALARSNGTSMTINPTTGYPEAFNLRALVPALLGLGLNAIAPGVGSAIGNALGTSAAVGTGVAVGGATAAASGSLKKGIMAGLGAYGGAGLGEGLAGTAGMAGTPTPVPGMEGVAGSGVSTVPPPTDPSLVGNQYSLSSSTPTGFNPEFGTTARSLTTPTNFTDLGTGVPSTSAFPNADLYSSAPTMGTGATVSPSTPMTSVSSPGFIDRVGGAGSAFKYGSAALAPAMQPEPLEAPKSTAMIRPYDFEYNPQTGAYDRPAGDTSEAAYFSPTYTARDPYLAAEGGLMNSYAAGGLTAFKQGGRPKSRSLMGEDYYKFMGRDDTMLGTAEKNFAGGGTPRFLSGGGDGMSDDIPAVIGDKQPARLADGEFVIPADVVSHLGNGSSKAGAKRLYEMMADIRKERTGTKKQAPAIKPSKFMPA